MGDCPGVTWADLLLTVAAATAPLLPLDFVSGRLIAHARSLWILAVLTVGIVWVAQTELWLALIGLCFLARWPKHPDPPTLLPSLIHWAAVAASWGLMLQIPKPWFSYAAWAWLAFAGWQSLLVIANRFKWGGRQKGTLGSPVITALYLALVSPFCPWWGWPLLGAGLGLISSFLAFAGVGMGLVWLYPSWWPLGAVAVTTGAILWAWSPMVGGRRVLEWLPRGDTFDSVVSRWRGWSLICHHGTERWLLGHGPGSMEPALLRWGSRYDMELTWGEGFNEALHVYYEYGLLGILAVGAFCWRIGPNLTLGDPWSAAWIVGVVLSLGHWPLRHASIGLVWLAISARLAQ